MGEMEASQRPDYLIEIKIMVLESQTYTLRVDKCIPILALKEQIASVSGVITEHQRLIFRGTRLMDDKLLSDYHVEDGHTLHLVTRLRSPETASNNAADDPALSGASESRRYHNRVLLGLQNFFRATESGVNPTVSNPPVSGIPDFLTVISGLLSRLRQEFAVYGNNSQASQMSMGNEQVTLESWQRRPSRLAEVLGTARQLLTGEVAECLSNISMLLVDHVHVTDPSARRLRQERVIQSGTLLQSLGDSLMHLGHATTRLRLGETPENAFVDVHPPLLMLRLAQNDLQLPPAQPGASIEARNSDPGGSSEAQNTDTTSEEIEETQIVPTSQDESQ